MVARPVENAIWYELDSLMADDCGLVAAVGGFKLEGAHPIAMSLRNVPVASLPVK
jgi:hypothetical protein